LLLGACSQAVDWRGEGKNFLTLTAFVQASDESASLEGYFRWVFYSNDPFNSSTAETFCEAWEYFELSEASVSTDCAACNRSYEGEAELQTDSPTTCEDLDWGVRSAELAWGALSDLDAPADEVDRYTSEGYSHRVMSRWSPEAGTLDTWDALFVARPEQWSPDDGEEGSPDEVELDGQYVLDSRFFWDLASE